MSDSRDSGSSMLPGRWALVNLQGELEDSDGDSSASSIELVQGVTESKPEEEFIHHGASSSSSQVEDIELEQLMIKADAEAVAVSHTQEAGSSASAASEIGATPPLPPPPLDLADHHLFHHPSSSLEEPPGPGSFRKQPGKEEDDKQSTLPSANRGNVMERGCQTDSVSPTLSERCLSLSSLWSLSSKSSGSDTSGASEISSATTSAETDQGEHSASSETDTDTEPEFICLETDTSCDHAQSAESNLSGSEVKASTVSRTSIGSEFEFLTGGRKSPAILNTTDSLSSPSPQQQRPQNQQQQPTSSEQPCPEEQRPTSVPRSENSYRQRLSLSEPLPATVSSEDLLTLVTEFMESQASNTVLSQDLQGSVSRDSGASVRRRTSCSEQNDAVAQPDPTLTQHDTITAQNNSGPTTAAGRVEVQHHTRSHPVPNLRRWLKPRDGLVVGAVLLLLLAFNLGHHMGSTSGQSRMLESQLSHMEELRQTQDQHTQCELKSQYRQQQSDAALKREREVHDATVAELRGDKHTLARRLKETVQQRDQLLLATSRQQRSPLHNADRDTKDEQHGVGLRQKKERRKERQRNNRVWTDSAPPIVRDEEKSDTLRHLFFSLREERDIGINTSDYLHYFTRSVNVSGLLHSLTSLWNSSSQGWKERAANVSDWVSGVGERVVEKLPGVWGGVSSTMSHTYQVLSNTLSSVRSHHTKGGGDNEKNGEEKKRDWSEDSGDKGAFGKAENDQVNLNSKYRKGTREEASEKVDWAEKENDEDDKETGEETFSGNKQHRRWRGFFRKVLKKTRKAFTRVGRGLEKTWRKIKNTSWKLWSKNSALSRFTAHVKSSFDNFSCKLLKVVECWFKNHPKEEKHSKAFHGKGGSHTGSGEERIKSSHHGNEKNEPKYNKAGEERNENYKSDGHNKYRGKGLSNTTANEAKGRTSEQVRKDQKKDKLIKDKGEGMSEKGKKIKPDKFVRDEKNEEYEDNQQKNRKKLKNTDKEKNKKENSKKKDKTRPAKKEKIDAGSQRITEGTSSKVGGNGTKKHKQDRLGKAEKENVGKNGAKSDKSVEKEGIRKNKNRSGKPAGQRGENKHEENEQSRPFEHLEDPQTNTMNTQHITNTPDHMFSQSKPSDSYTAQTHGHTSANTARTKFKLESRFQEVFSTVGSMDVTAYRALTHDDTTRMLIRVLALAQHYNHHLHLGLALSGSRWLECQHGFWDGAVSRSTQFKPTQSCLQFLAPWQLTVLREEEEENFTATDIQVESRTTRRNGDDQDVDSDDVFVESEDEVHEDSTLDWTDEFDGDFLGEWSEELVETSLDSNSDSDIDDNSHCIRNSHDSCGDNFQQNQFAAKEDAPENIYAASRAAQSSDFHKANKEWYMHRSEGRNSMRLEDHKADWMFQRATERDRARVEGHAADWVFERAADRDIFRQEREEEYLRQKKLSQQSSHSEEEDYEEDYVRSHHGKRKKAGFKHGEKGYRRKYGHATCVFC